MVPSVIINFPADAALPHVEWRTRVCKAAIRAQHGTTKVFSDHCGCSVALVNNIIRGLGTSKQMQTRLAVMLGLPLETLFPRRAA